MVTVPVTYRGKHRFYYAATRVLRQRLVAVIPRDELRRLHRRSARRHFAVVARQVGLLVGLAVALGYSEHPVIWVPLALLQGFVLFGFTVLLHEAVHEIIFARRRPVITKALAWLYALPCALSPSQFARWHLDHHAELGSATDDPKRSRLSPKRNRRWIKLLYFTPVLFFIYFRAATAEARTYPEWLQHRVVRERRLALAVHLALVFVLAWAGGVGVLSRVYLVPLLVAFPIAFMLNRLGQHYDIDPNDPARWSTLIQPSPMWDFLFLNSGYHLEHHYFPQVPFYNLPALHRRLIPFFEQTGLVPRGYGRLVWQYLILNRPPHANWG